MFSRHLAASLQPALRRSANILSKPCSQVLRPLSSTPALCARGSQGPSQNNPKIMLEDEKAFGFIRHNSRPPKPRKVGVTEIRGPYYSAMGKRYLQDVLET